MFISHLARINLLSLAHVLVLSRHHSLFDNFSLGRSRTEHKYETVWWDSKEGKDGLAPNSALTFNSLSAKSCDMGMHIQIGFGMESVACYICCLLVVVL